MKSTTRQTLELLAEGKCPYRYANFSQEEAQEILAALGEEFDKGYKAGYSKGSQESEAFQGIGYQEGLAQQ